MRTSRPVPAVLLAGTAVALAACAGNPPGSAENKVKITSSDSACTVGATKLDSGKLIFDVVNVGTKPTEVDVYGQHGAGGFTRMMSEVENVAPGKSADLVVKLGGGTYEIACKPGGSGPGIRQRITIAGKAAPVESPAIAFDRQIVVALTDTGATGLEKLTVKPGETISFLLENNSTQRPGYLEIIGPDGQEVGQITGVAPGDQLDAIITLTEPGQYSWRVGDHASGTFMVK
ncbi:MAG: cupredoxin domain-containing protein [Sporichthyaceae bacterium]|nr:cupredoxin domain-containing protein [Sporichthyaceae bacterium]